MTYPPSQASDAAPDDAVDRDEQLEPADAPEVALGQPMPEVRALPVLSTATMAPAPMRGPLRHSMLAHGLSFVGSATVEGSLTVAGEVSGQLDLPAPAHGHVTITETGSVDGDIRARNISVLGRTHGLLDAAGGKVSLHDSASVSGRIRYTHLQVNGADLNAQLERVRPNPDEPPAG